MTDPAAPTPVPGNHSDPGNHNDPAGKRETFNPWSVVNLVFHHLAAQGLHPVLGDAGDPSVPATALLRALGIEPGQDHEGPAATLIQDELARVRVAMNLD